MVNHYHLLLQTPQPNLSRGMRHLNGVYAQRFNRRHDRVGHVFQARFHSKLVDSDEYLLAVASYLPRNPVDADICASPSDWPWSSYRATIGLDGPRWLAFDRLLHVLADDLNRARDRYRALVESDDAAQCLLAFEARGANGPPGVETVAAVAAPREIPRRYWLPPRRPLCELLVNRGDGSIAAAYRQHGYTMREIGDFLGVHYATVSRRIQRYEADVGLQDLTPV
jgi:hypothetical protein